MIRSIRVLRELALMLQGFKGAAKAVVWATVLVFFILTFWSLVSVELIHPIVRELAEQGKLDDCPRCSRAFRSVMEANLTWTQTIIAGDAWGKYSLPIIEEAPASSIVLVGALLTVNLAAMNLVLSVIVDAAVDSRESDTEIKLVEKERRFKSSLKELTTMFTSMDKDGS